MFVYLFTDSVITEVFDFLAIDWVTDTKKENFVKITEKNVVSCLLEFILKKTFTVLVSRIIQRMRVCVHSK